MKCRLLFHQDFLPLLKTGFFSWNCLLFQIIIYCNYMQGRESGIRWTIQVIEYTNARKYRLVNDKSGKTYKNLLKVVDETIPDQNELQISCADMFCDKAYIYCVCCACVTNFSLNTIFMFEKIIYLAVLVKVNSTWKQTKSLHCFTLLQNEYSLFW